MSALDGIRQRVEAATKGPWDRFDAQIRHTQIDGWIDPEGRRKAKEQTERDIEFIANARTDIPRLLAALDAVLALSDNAVPVIGLNGTYEGFVMPADIRGAVNDALEDR